MAIIGGVLMFASGALRPSDALHFVDFGTVVLLFSMMLLVAYLHVAGFFDWVTERVVAGRTKAGKHRRSDLSTPGGTS